MLIRQIPIILSGFSKHLNWLRPAQHEGLHGRKPDSSTANWMIHSNYSLTMGRFEIRRDLAHEFSSGGSIRSGENTKMGIHEQTIFQGKMPEYSQTTRTRRNNDSLTSHEVCWIIKIAMFISSERHLIT
jgi:hypothetical protein